VKRILSALFIFSCLHAHAQKVENIYANLYTDSLKKGTYNYINIDGQLSNGKYLPLDSTKISFSSPQAKFYGNTIFIPADFKEEKVNIHAVLREDPTKFKDLVIYIKKMEDPPLRSAEEVLRRRKG